MRCRPSRLCAFVSEIKFMLQNIKQLYGMKLGATDGDIGHVKDSYFDDKTWVIRYLVADTGSWLSGRQVLLSPHAFGTYPFWRSDADFNALRVNLTRKQIENSPSIDSHRPVSRQFEQDYHLYYGWPGYWADSAVWGGAGIAPVGLPPIKEAGLHHGHNQREDLHLRSTKAVTGYKIQATDGEIGCVNSFMVDDKWSIQELLVETGHWYAGKTIIIRRENISRISHDDAAVLVNLTMDAIKRTANEHVAHSGAGQR
jgi:uncharacterized protein YrrD